MPKVWQLFCAFEHHAYLKFLFVWSWCHCFFSLYLSSGETSERNSAIRGGGQQYLLGVSATLSSGDHQVALPEGREEETGEE